MHEMEKQNAIDEIDRLRAENNRLKKEIERLQDEVDNERNNTSRRGF